MRGDAVDHPQFLGIRQRGVVERLDDAAQLMMFDVEQFDDVAPGALASARG